MHSYPDTDIDPKFLLPPPPRPKFSAWKVVLKVVDEENFQIILHGGTGLAEI